MTKQQLADLERIRAKVNARRRMDADDDGRWVTTEDDHKLHINSEGDIDKGNPYVVKAIKGFKVKEMKSVPVGARLKNGDTYYVKTASGDFINQTTGEVVDDDELSRCKRDSETRVKNSYGEEIDLSHCPLNYGGKMSLDSDTRKSVDSFENKRKSAKIEYGCLLDAWGDPVGQEEYRGGHGSVSYPLKYVQYAETLTHIHPRKQGSLTPGGTFSAEDLDMLSYGIRNLRAAASEGVYSIKRGKNMDTEGFVKWAKSEMTRTRNNYKAAMKPLNDDIRKVSHDYTHGKITRDEYEKKYSEYVKQSAQHFNAYVVEDHNTLLSGQDRFGYEYTLERWD